MKVIKWVFMFLLFEVSLFSYVQAQEIIVYPAKGQSNDQMYETKKCRINSPRFAWDVCTSRWK